MVMQRNSGDWLFRRVRRKDKTVNVPVVYLKSSRVKLH